VANTDTVAGVTLSAGKITVVGLILREKSAGGLPPCTLSEACVLTARPFTVAAKATATAVAGIADTSAVNVTGNAVPGVRESVAGEIVTPDGNPDTVMVTMPPAVAPASSSEACCPFAPAVKVMLDGVSANVG
jgi:hypothetical protein